MVAPKWIRSQPAALALVAAMLSTTIGCGAMRPTPPPPPTPLFEETPVPTVPPSTPAPKPSATPVPVPTRAGAAARPDDGMPIGPEILYFGAARADGVPVEPISVSSDGVPTYRSSVGSGFMLVVETRAGRSGLAVGRRVFAHVPDDPSVRPDLEIQSTRPLGDGSPAVCDRRRPKIGGIPAISPPSFAPTQQISDAINDFACRFETFNESEFSCTMNAQETYAFVDEATEHQFCMIVARAYRFPEGVTELRVRVSDTAGNPGAIARLRIDRPVANATEK